MKNMIKILTVFRKTNDKIADRLLKEEMKNE